MLSFDKAEYHWAPNPFIEGFANAVRARFPGRQAIVGPYFAAIRLGTRFSATNFVNCAIVASRPGWSWADLLGEFGQVAMFCRCENTILN